MTTPTNRSPFSFEAFSTFTALGVYRFTIGVPLDFLTKTQIMTHSLSGVQLKDLRLGYQAKIVQYLFVKQVEAYTTTLASHIVPIDLPPAMRGLMMASLATPVDVFIRNGVNATHTRLVQKQSLREVIQEVRHIWLKGYLSTLGHRLVSSWSFMGPYMYLHEKFPDHPAAVGAFVGVGIQVPITSPFYVTAVLRQAKRAPEDPALPPSLWGLMKHVSKTEGAIKGLFLRGLGLRCLHSALTSSLVMHYYEKYNLIYR